MTCENCGAPFPVDRTSSVLICGYCSSECLASGGEDGVLLSRTTEFDCPTCASSLAEGTIEAQMLLYCGSCRGMLIEMGSFMGLIQALRSYRDRPAEALPPRGPDGRPPLACPRCSLEMSNHFYCGPGNVRIDTCETCAVNWLDKAELQRIVSAPDSTYAPRTVYAPVSGPEEPSGDLKFFPFNTD